MKKPLAKITLALILCTAMLMPMCTAYETVKTGTVLFTEPSLSDDTLLYSDVFFMRDNTAYDRDLALLSLAFSAAASTAKSQKADKLLSSLGFTVRANDAFAFGATSEDSIGYLFAQKPLLTTDGRETGKTLLTVLVRSAGYQSEWGGNALLGAFGDAENFAARSDEIAQELNRYTAQNLAGKTVIYYLCGHSRGGAIAGLTAKRLCDEGKTVFCYTSGAPMTGTKSNNYPMIHNLILPCDIVPQLAPSTFGFHRYGEDIEITPAKTATFSLAYCPIDLTADIATLTKQIKSVKTAFVPYPDGKQMQADAYWDDLRACLCDPAFFSRADYVSRTFLSDVTAERALCETLRICLSLPKADRAALGDCLKGCNAAFQKLNPLDALSAISALQNIPQWNQLDNETKRASLHMLWRIINDCEANGKRIADILGDDIAVLERDFPVLADMVLDAAARDFKSDAKPLTTIATLLYNFDRMAQSHTVSAYYDALRHTLSVSPENKTDTSFVWVLVEYTDQGAMRSFRAITQKNPMVFVPSGTKWKLICFGPGLIPCRESISS